jgi:membrane protease YdiL (CAAX protease family)
MNSNESVPNPSEQNVQSDSPNADGLLKGSDDLTHAVAAENGGELHPSSAIAVSDGHLIPHSLIPEDLRVPWSWWDLLLLVVIGVAGILVLSVLIIFGFQWAGISREQLQQSANDQALFSIIAIFFISLFLLAYLAAQSRFRFRMPFWRTLGWRPFDTGQMPRQVAYMVCILGGVSLSMLVALASSAFTPKNKMPIEQFLQDRHSAILLLVLSVTIAPLFEETIFRGYIYPVAARSFGVAGGVLFTGALFGLMHASQLGGNIPQVGLLVIVGIVFTAVRAKTGSVFPGYLLHVSYNSFIAGAFLVATHALRHMPVAQVADWNGLAAFFS